MNIKESPKGLGQNLPPFIQATCHHLLAEKHGLGQNIREKPHIKLRPNND